MPAPPITTITSSVRVKLAVVLLLAAVLLVRPGGLAPKVAH